MDERLGKLIKASEAIKELLAAVAFEVQEKCAHEECYECEYEPDNYGHRHRPPRRICLECRLVEEGWGCGYKLLENSKVLEVIERREMFKMQIPGRAGIPRKN